MSRKIYLLVLMLLSACSEPEPEQSMARLLTPDSGGYSKVVAGNKLSFPEDHQEHPSFRQEWWYLTAVLHSEGGEEIGLQWTQFRMALSSSGTSEMKEGGWKTNQVYMAHSAVTTNNRHVAAEKWSRQHRKMAYVLPDPLTIKLDNWVWQSLDEELFPAELTVKGDDFSYRLSLKSSSPFQMQGENGYSRKSADGTSASYYYSQPFIDVEGELSFEGKHQNVTGQAWLDREWSSQGLKRGQQGWDWFGLRLDDGSALMLYRLRGNKEKESNFLSARRMYPDGKGRSLIVEETNVIPVSFQKINGISYPVSWEIHLPEEQINITVDALNPEAKMPLTIPYWEGPVSISGSHGGEGYMELTGY